MTDSTLRGGDLWNWGNPQQRSLYGNGRSMYWHAVLPWCWFYMWDLVVRCLGKSRERKSKLASPLENGFCPPFWGVKLRNVNWKMTLNSFRGGPYSIPYKIVALGKLSVVKALSNSLARNCGLLVGQLVVLINNPYESNIYLKQLPRQKGGSHLCLLFPRGTHSLWRGKEGVTYYHFTWPKGRS